MYIYIIPMILESAKFNNSQQAGDVDRFGNSKEVGSFNWMLTNIIH